MRYLKTFESTGFNIHSKRDEIEDCSDDLTDLSCFRHANSEALELRNPKNGDYGYIKYCGGLDNVKYPISCSGTYKNGRIYPLGLNLGGIPFSLPRNLPIELMSSYQEIKRENPQAYNFLNEILDALKSVLRKLKIFVLKDFNIEFIINCYEVQYGTCVVVLVKFFE